MTAPNILEMLAVNSERGLGFHVENLRKSIMELLMYCSNNDVRGFDVEMMSQLRKMAVIVDKLVAGVV